MALWKLRRERGKWRHVRVRTCRYLNNIVVQDHRGTKARCGPLKGFKTFATGVTTPAGFELANRIRKRLFNFGRRLGYNRKIDWDIALS